MNIYAQPGHRVRYDQWENGSKYDREKAEQHLVRGSLYTIASTSISSWSTDVWFEETGPKVSFNSVLFSDYA